jgi:hypothetical protein
MKERNTHQRVAKSVPRITRIRPFAHTPQAVITHTATVITQQSMLLRPETEPSIFSGPVNAEMNDGPSGPGWMEKYHADPTTTSAPHPVTNAASWTRR